MMNRVGEYRKQLGTILGLVLIGGPLVLVLIWWLLGLFGLNDLFRAVVVSSIGVANGVVVTLKLQERLVQPIEQISGAIRHVSEDPSTAPPPVPADAPFTTHLIKDIYDLASSSHTQQSKLHEKKDFLKRLLDDAPVTVLAFNTDQMLTFVNNYGLTTLHYAPDEPLAGLSLTKVIDWHFPTDFTYDIWLEQARGNKLQSRYFWERVSLLLTDNTRIIGDLSVFYQKENDEAETIVVFTDRTNEYQADEAELDFVAVAAHELRGPITVIRGYLDVFQQELKDVFNVEQRGLLQKMTVSAEMLSLYVNNILNVARLDQQGLKLHVRESDWREVIKEAYADLFLRAQAHGRILKLELPDQLPTVGVDRVSITEVINNLVDNAIKYSKEGDEINIRVVQNEGLISTTVEDHGIGIPQSVVGNLFKKFYRSHRTRQGVSGTGLGLYLSKAILDAHGGNIWVRSTEGEGSTFGFDLPIYSSIAESMKKGDNAGTDIKRSSHGWIKNHKMYRR